MLFHLRLPGALAVSRSGALATMLSVTHVHTLSQPMLFALLSFIFAFSSLREKTKATFITLFFAGSVLSNLSPWLVRYSSANFVYCFPLSQAMIATCLFTMAFCSLKDLWCARQS